MSSLTEESHNALQRSATPNTSWTDNPAYWNKYELATLEQHATLPTEACMSCSEKFIPEVAGQLFCSEDCYCPPCSICNHDIGLLEGDNEMTSGLHLCAGCYWDAEEIWRHQRAKARKVVSEEEAGDVEEERDDEWWEEEEGDAIPQPSDFAPGKVYEDGRNYSDFFYSRVKVRPDGTLLELDCCKQYKAKVQRVFSSWSDWQTYCSPSRY